MTNQNTQPVFNFYDQSSYNPNAQSVNYTYNIQHADFKKSEIKPEQVSESIPQIVAELTNTPFFQKITSNPEKHKMLALLGCALYEKGILKGRGTRGFNVSAFQEILTNTCKLRDIQPRYLNRVIEEYRTDLYNKQFDAIRDKYPEEFKVIDKVINK